MNKTAADLTIGDRILTNGEYHPIVKAGRITPAGKRMIVVDAGLIASDGEKMFVPYIINADETVEVAA